MSRAEGYREIVVARAHASVNPADLAALKQLFEKDPATAFEKSWKLFQEPRKKEDLGGMGRRSGTYGCKHRLIIASSIGM